MATEAETVKVETKDIDVETKTEESIEKEEENVTSDGGVKKKIIRKGDGWRTPEKGFEAKVHYVGKLVDGTVFDSSRDRNEPFTFKLGGGQVIKGWEEGVMSMKKGEISLFTLTPEYAYGKSGSPPKIPPDSTLQFEIELLEWIEEKDVSETRDGSVLKRVLKEGDGWEKPKDDTKVKVNYIAKLSDNETVIEEKKDFEFVIGAEQTIKGLDDAVMSMKKGEKSLVSIKPHLAYGASGNADLKVPANETLKFEIELLEFEKQKERWDMSKEEKLETALKRKDEGNELFTNQKLARALKKYKAALELFEYDTDLKGEDKEKANKIKIPCYLNIAACKMKQKNWVEVKDNCTKAIEIDNNNVKALFRRGIALSELDEWEAARKDLTKALELDPKNGDIKKEIAKLKQKMSEQDKKDKAMFARMFKPLETTKGKVDEATENNKENDTAQV